MQVLVLAILLTSTPSLRAQTVENLKPTAFDAKLEDVAKALQKGEVCERNLNDTTVALNECASRVGDDQTGIHLAAGAVGGLIIGFFVCSLAHCGGH